MEKDCGVIDGNYSRTWDVSLDIPGRIYIFCVIKRYFKYRNRTGPDIYTSDLINRQMFMVGGKDYTEKLDVRFYTLHLTL
ncbi:hypothetical protein AM501_08805 [Aneurinibacillus migulanus]|nr:hypothetical protein TS64_06760 [Aneurinibacillus migulanus]KPD08671.1 hypothetical protein AM501_08805 [Aneurinibacillus migulanus]